MRPHSLELRRRILEAYDAGEGSLRGLATRFKVSPSTVQRYLERWRKAGSAAPRPPGGGNPRALDTQAEQLLGALLDEQNDLPDHEYARRLATRLGRPVSRQAVNRAWKRMGVAREGKVLRAPELGEPDERER